MARTYHSKVRARAALETRTAVLAAARDLFAEIGYARASVAAIAERAGVAVNTVYTSVGGKPALIQALVGESAGDRTIDVAVAEIRGLSDGREVLCRTADETGRFSEKHAAILRILFDNATADPAVAAAAAEVGRLYRERITAIGEHFRRDWFGSYLSYGRDSLVLLRHRGLADGPRVRLGMGGGVPVVSRTGPGGADCYATHGRAVVDVSIRSVA